jgi:hypothetical protein
MHQLATALGFKAHLTSRLLVFLFTFVVQTKLKTIFTAEISIQGEGYGIQFQCAVVNQL